MHYFNLKSLSVILLYRFSFISTSLGTTSNNDVVCHERIKFIHVGENLALTCSFSSVGSAATWFKQIPGEKPLLIASSFQSMPVTYHNDFDKSGRFIALKEQWTFNLSISNAEASDSATYFCAVGGYTTIGLGACTVVVRKDHSAVSQHPVLDHVELGGNTTLQCSLLTESCSEDHSVYWFRHIPGESHPGIIYTHVNRNDQCKKSSETDSTTQSCVYKLPKINLSLSDTGTYYCAVAACGEILFGNGTKLDFLEDDALDPICIVLAASNIISIIVVLFLCKKLYSSRYKDVAEDPRIQANQAEDTGDLKYAALKFTQPSSSRRSRTKDSSDQPVYTQVNTHQ